jgi:tRNA dimethylallyltransferase
MKDSNLLRTLDVFLEGAKKPLVVVLGPTASGKTSLSINIAKHVNGEVVNADSRQLYKMLDIGTAKISKEEMNNISHYLLDIKDPKEEVTVGWYQEETSKIIAEIHKRGSVPMLVGGSMLYISSIIDGLTFASSVDPEIHKRLENEYDEDGGIKLYKKLQKIDPDTASNIHQNNKPYVIRAMEIYELHQMPKAEVVSKKGCSYDLLIFGMEVSRDILVKRIEDRTDAMFESGWIDEVRELLRLGYTENDPGMKSCGYREIIQYLRETDGVDSDSDISLDILKKRIVTKTRQYAKRQMTWWRGDDRIRWII